jgi:V8-like Glu-specific endopeptidase
MSRRFFNHKSNLPRRNTAARLTLETLDERIVLSATPTAATGLAAKAIVDLKVTYPNQKVALGTGAMIDQFHVLTAAHLLYSAADGGYATSVVAAPGAKGSETPYGTANATYVRVDPAWIGFSQAHPSSTSPSVQDVGLVTLDRTIGKSTGSFTIGTQSDSSFRKATFQTAGYPTLGGLHMAAAVAVTSTAQSTVSGYGVTFKQSDLPATPGQSGSPIWKAAGKKATVYGVVTGADGLEQKDTVYATRLTKDIYNELKTWLKQDKAPKATPKGPISAAHPTVKAAALKTKGAPVVVQALGDYERIVYDDNAPKSTDVGYYDHSGSGEWYDGSSVYPYFDYYGGDTSSNQWYGNFLGPGNAGWDTYPINSLDAAAWQHDLEYDLTGGSGPWSALFDTSLSGTDWTLASNAWNSYMNDSSLGWYDQAWALGTAGVFGGIAYGKELWNTGSSWADSVYSTYDSLLNDWSQSLYNWTGGVGTSYPDYTDQWWW